jgi:hypothetical protein
MSLAATIVSLCQVGFGRVVVVGYNDGDVDLAQDSFALLRSDTAGNSTSKDQSPVTRIGNTELGYARATLEEVTSATTPINLVKGALAGLQCALKGDMEEGRAKEWLGNAHDISYWKYVYLTEPDTILQSRPAALSHLREALDEGLIIAPHRLQPLPHESDLKGMKRSVKYLPATGNFSNVIELNPLKGGVCCDALRGKYKPWRNFEKCGSFWWQCGFNARQNHTRLEEYQLLRLQTGTGIVNLAGSEHGRQCLPSPNGVCSLDTK